MNLLYFCIFQQSELRALRLFFSTLIKRGQLNTNLTRILALTSNNLIAQVKTIMADFNVPYDYYIPEIDSADSDEARLHVHMSPLFNIYQKVLFLDTRVLINGKLKDIFNLSIKPGEIYSIPYGKIGDYKFGAPLFEFTDYDRTESAFYTGVMYFVNDDSIRKLFEDVLSLSTKALSLPAKSGCRVLRETYSVTPFLVYTAICQTRVNTQQLSTIIKIHTDTLEAPEKDVLAYCFIPGTTDTHQTMLSLWKKMFSVAFITLTNTGYINYTLNCLESLRRIGSEVQLQSYCVGSEGCAKMKQNGYLCEEIDTNNRDQLSDMQTYKNTNWAGITFCKMPIIYKTLLAHDYVLFTDGDIVYENPNFYDYLIEQIGNNDLLIQDEWTHTYAIDSLCTGLMFIQSSSHIQRFFNPSNIDASSPSWDDQIYINHIRHNFKFKRLPLDLFPTGHYYYKNHLSLDPYVVHFNWLRGTEKEQKMRELNKWYIDQPQKRIADCSVLNILQEKSADFGYYFEGLLRLLSLSLNSKAQYVCDYNQTYVFEDDTTDSETFAEYINRGLKTIQPNCILNSGFYTKNSEQIKSGSFPIQSSDGRSISEIQSLYTNFADNIYALDGIVEQPRCETSDDLNSSLPILRNAFVLKNPHLPPYDYSRSRVNVCAYVRVNDPVMSQVIEHFQAKEDTHRVILHIDETATFDDTRNTIIQMVDTTDTLYKMNDLIHADILLLDASSLSIVAHILADPKQTVIFPDSVKSELSQRLLPKCISCSEFLRTAK
jgi:hypothetical protein